MITAECGCQQGRLSLIGPRYAVDIWPELQSSGGAVIVEATSAAVSELLGDRERHDVMWRRPVVVRSSNIPGCEIGFMG